MMRPALQKQVYIEVQQEEHIQEEQESYRFLADFKELETVIEEIVVDKEEQHSFSLSPANNQGDKEHLRWYYPPAPDLLDLIKAILSGEFITEYSYKFIIDCLDYNRGYPRAKKPELRVLALEALVYYVRNNKQYLKPESLQTIFKIATCYANERNNKNEKIVLTYTTLIFAYALINGYILDQNAQRWILIGLDYFMQQPKKFIPFIAVCLHAKMLIEPEVFFTEPHWQIVSALLCPVFSKTEDELSQLFHIEEKIGYLDEEFISGIYGLKSFSKLNYDNLKTIQKKLIHAPLTKGALSKIIESWEYLTKDKEKNLLIDIIYTSISKGQVNFPQGNQFQKQFLMLINTITAYNKDIKLIPTALSLMLRVIKNASLDFNDINKTTIESALAASRVHILGALNEYHIFHGKNMPYQYVEKISILKTNLNIEVKEAAQYTYSLITDEILHLEFLILKPDTCLKATALCLKSAEQKKIIPLPIVKHLINIVSDETLILPVEAIHNSWNTLIFIAKNKNKLPETEYRIIRQLISAKDNYTLNYTILLLGYYSLVDNILLEKQVLIEISKLLDLLDINDTLLINVISAIGNLFLKAEYEDLLAFDEEIDLIICKISNLLGKKNIAKDHYNNTMTALEKVTSKKYALSENAVASLFSSFNYLPSDDHHIKILHILAQGINKKIAIKNEDIDTLLILLNSPNRHIGDNASEVLCSYIKMNDNLILDQENFKKLNKLIKNKEIEDKVIKIFRYLAEKNLRLDNSIMEYFIANVSHENPNITYYALNGLLEQAKTQVFDVALLNKIQRLICDTENSTVIFYLVETLYCGLSFKNEISYASLLKKSLCIKLISIVKKNDFDYKTKKGALNFLYFASKKGKFFSWELINSLFKLVKVEEDIFASIALKIIQVQFLNFKSELIVEPENLSAFLKEIEKIVLSKILTNSYLIKDVLHLLNITNQHYRFDWSDKLIDFMADLQLFEGNHYLSRYAMSLLYGLPKKRLTEKAYSVTCMEKAAKNIKKIGFNFSKLIDISLLSCVEKYGYLTIRNYELLTKLIKTGHPNLKDCLLISYTLAKKQVKLPENLLSAIKNYVFENNRKYSPLGELKILIEVAKYDRVLTNNIFTLVFEKIDTNLVDKKTPLVDQGTFLDVIELAIKNHFPLEDKVIKKLFFILRDYETIEQQSQSIRLLKEICNINKISVLQLIKIINNFKEIYTEKDKENNTLTIINAINYNVKLLTPKIKEKLISIVTSDVLPSNIQLKLIDFLSENHSQIFCDYNITQLSHLLKLEDINYTVKDKLESLIWLSKANVLFSERVYKSIILLVREIVEQEIFDSLIDIMVSIKDYTNWPISLTEHLLSSPCLNQKLINTLLLKLANNFIFFSEPSLEILYQFFIENTNFNDEEAYKALEIINSHQPLNAKFNALLQLDKITDLDNFLSYIKSFSINLPYLPHKIIFFIIQLSRMVRKYSDSIKILYCYKKDLTVSEAENIIEILINNDLDLVGEFFYFYQYLLQKLKFEDKALNRINEALYMNLLNNEFIEPYLICLNELSQFSPLYLDLAIIEKLIYTITKAIKANSDITLHISILFQVLCNNLPVDFFVNTDFSCLIESATLNNKALDVRFYEVLYAIFAQTKIKILNSTEQNILKKLRILLSVKLELLDEIDNCFTDEQKISLYFLFMALSSFIAREPKFGIPTITLHAPDFYTKGFLCESILLQSFDIEKFSKKDEESFFKLMHHIEIKFSFENNPPLRDNFLLNILATQKEKQLSLNNLNKLLDLVYHHGECPFQVLKWGKEKLISHLVVSQLNFVVLDRKYCSTFNQISDCIDSLDLNFLTINNLLCQLLHNSLLNKFINLLKCLVKLSISSKDIEYALAKITSIQNKEQAFYQFQIKLLDLGIYSFIQKLLQKIDQEKLAFLRFNFISSSENLLRNDWDFFKLYEFFKKISNSSYGEAEILIEKLNFASIYNIKEDNFYYAIHSEVNLNTFYLKKIKLKFKDKGIKKLIDKIKKINNFSEMLDEKASNPSYSLYLENLLQEEKMSTLIADINQSYTYDKGIFKFPICDWHKQDIRQWAINLKKKSTIENLYDDLPLKLAVIRKACELCFKYSPYHIQQLSVLLLYYNDPNKRGRFAQIPTGSGKTTIIAILVVLLGLHNEKCDIATSTSELAVRDYQFTQEFYELFNITSACNIEKFYIKGAKQCYSKDVVYGDASTFQFDNLRHRFSLLGTLGARSCNNLIIDEVDKFVINEINKVATIAEATPGMEEFRFVFLAIWTQLETIEINLFGNLVRNQKDFSLNTIQKNAIKEALTEYIDVLLFSSNIKENELKQISLNPLLKEYAQLQKEGWINSAILACYFYKYREHYVLSPNQHHALIIAPVDIENGMTELSTVWQDGLQQFLQLKHGLHFTPPTLSTNYLSNKAFINFYSGRVLGLTGTLGSSEAKKLIQSICNVDYINIPFSRPRQVTTLTPLLIDDEKMWRWTIGSSCVREAYLGRVVLIVCDCIAKAEKIYDFLKEKLKFKGKLYSYIESNAINRQFIDSLFSGNTIIVATNLASRGTDIKITPEVIKKGGMHLCKTSPSHTNNTEIQIDGRAGRRGEPGTIQCVYYTLDVFKKFGVYPNNIETINIIRNQLEDDFFANVIINDLPLIQQKDDLFSRFCNFLNEFDNDFMNNKIAKAIGLNYHDKLSQLMRGKKQNYQRASLIEHWGLWLLRHANFPDALQKLEYFLHELNSLKNQNKLINNYHYYLLLGNLSLKKNYLLLKYLQNFDEEALAYYDSAILLEPDCYLAYYYTACAHIKKIQNAVLIKIEQTISPEAELEKLFNYKTTAKKALDTCYSIIKNKILMRYDTSLLFLSQSRFPLENNDLITQIRTDIELLNKLTQSIESLISLIESSQKLLNLKIFHGASTISYKRLLSNEISDLYISTNNAHPKINATLTFHDLIAYPDLGTQYQVLKIIKHSEKSPCSMIFINPNQTDVAWRKLIFNLLPINRHKSEQENASEEDESTLEKNEEKDDVFEGYIGKRDKVSNFFRKKAEHGIFYLDKAANKASKKLKTAKNHISNIKHKADDIIWQYEQLETLPFTLIFKKLKLDAGSFLVNYFYDSLPQKNKYNLNISLYDPSIELLKLIQKESFIYTSYQKYESDSYDKPCIISEKIENNTTSINHDSVKTKILFAQLSLEKAIKFLALISDFTGEVKLEFLNIQQIDIASVIIYPEEFELECEIKLRADNLTYNNIKKLLWLINDKYQSYILKIHQLNKDKLLKLAPKTAKLQENFTVQLLPLETELASLCQANVLESYVRRGWIGFFNIAENVPLPWRSVCLLISLSAIQIVGGIILVSCSHGMATQVGIDFILGGVRDIFTIASVCYNRKFKLERYLIEKTITYSLSLITLGIGCAIKAAKIGADVSEAAMLAANLEVEHLDNAILLTKDLIHYGAKTTATATQAVNLTHNVINSAINIAGLAINQVADTTITLGGESLIYVYQVLIKQQISQEMQYRIKRRSDWSIKLNRLFALDCYLKESYKIKLLDEVKNIINDSPNKIKLIDDKWLDPRLFSQFEIDLNKIFVEFKLPSFHKIFVMKVSEVVSEKYADELYNFFSKYNIIVNDETIHLETLRLLDENEIKNEDKSFFKSSKKYYQAIIKIFYHYNLIMEDEYPSSIEALIESIADSFLQRLKESFSQFVSVTTTAIKTAVTIGLEAGLGQLKTKISANSVVSTASKQAISTYRFISLSPIYQAPKAKNLQLFKECYSALTKITLLTACVSLHGIKINQLRKLRADFNVQIYKIKKINWQLQHKKRITHKKIMSKYTKLIKLTIATVLMDADENSLKTNDYYDNDFINQLDEIFSRLLHALRDRKSITCDMIKAGDCSPTDEKLLITIRDLFKNYLEIEEVIEMENALALLNNEGLENIVQQLTGFAERFPTKGPDRMLLCGKLGPFGYGAASVINTVGEYLRSSQQNEALLTQTIQTMSHDVIAASREMQERMMNLAEASQKLIIEITDKGSGLLKDAWEKTNKDILELTNQKLDLEELRALKEIDLSMAQQHLKDKKDSISETKNLLKENLNTLERGIKAQIDAMVKLAHEILGGQLEHFQKCIEFYQQMIERAQATLNRVIDNNVSIVRQLIDAGKEILKRDSVTNQAQPQIASPQILAIENNNANIIENPPVATNQNNNLKISEVSPAADSLAEASSTYGIFKRAFRNPVTREADSTVGYQQKAKDLYKGILFNHASNLSAYEKNRAENRLQKLKSPETSFKI